MEESYPKIDITWFLEEVVRTQDARHDWIREMRPDFTWEQDLIVSGITRCLENIHAPEWRLQALNSLTEVFVESHLICCISEFQDKQKAMQLI